MIVNADGETVAAPPRIVLCCPTIAYIESRDEMNTTELFTYGHEF